MMNPKPSLMNKAALLYFLRKAHRPFVNLGNVVISPDEHRCYVFNQGQLQEVLPLP